MGLATTTLRAGLGAVMAGHGLQKLTGAFGGRGLDATAAGFEQMGFKPGRQYAMAAGLTETVGGSLLATGMMTPLGAAMVTGVMTTAIAKVHAKNGLWNSDGGAEYNLMIIAGAFALTEVGAGHLALDGLLTKRRRGFGWALVELAAGVAAGMGVVTLAERRAQSGAGSSGAGSSGSGPASLYDGDADTDGSDADRGDAGQSDAGESDAGGITILTVEETAVVEAPTLILPDEG